MAKLDPVLPEIIGRPPRGGTRNDRPVRMAWPDLSGAAKSLGNLADAGLDLSATLEKMGQRESEAGAALAETKRKEEDLLFTERWNAFVTETQRGLQKEVFSLKGEALTGAEGRMVDLVKKASATHSKGFSPDMARKWNAKVHAYANSNAVPVMRYRNQELSKAQLEAYAAEQKGYTAAFLATGDLSNLDHGVEALQKAFRLTRGNVIPAENLKELYDDIHDGDGKVKLPGGKALLIGKDITMESAVAEYERLKAVSDEYELAKQQYYDSAFAAMADQYIKAGEYDKLSGLLSIANDPGAISIPVSPNAFKVVEKEANLALEVHTDRKGAESALAQMQAGAGEDSKYYALSPETAQKVTIAIAALEKKGDPRSKRQADFLREAFKREQKAQEAELTSGAIVAAKQLMTDGAKGSEVAKKLAEKTDLLSRKTLEIYQAYRDGADALLKKDPETVAYRKGAVLLLQRAMDAGEGKVTIPLGGTPSTFDLRAVGNGKTVPSYDVDRVIEVALALGLSREEAAALGEYAVKANADDVIRPEDVYAVLKKEGFKNPEAFVLRFAPEIMKTLEGWDKKGDKEAWVKTRVNGVIREMVRTENLNWTYWDWAPPDERLRYYQSTGSLNEGWSPEFEAIMEGGDPAKKLELWFKMHKRGGGKYQEAPDPLSASGDK